MTLEELLQIKIDELKTLAQNQSDKSEIESQIISVDNAINSLLVANGLLVNADDFVSFDFDELVDKLVSDNSALTIKRMIHDSKIALSFNINPDESQLVALNKFSELLVRYKEKLKNELSKVSISNDDINKRIEDLQALLNIVKGVGRKKYYTEDMIKSFAEVVDLEHMDPNEASKILLQFYDLKNLQNIKNNNTTNNDTSFDEVVDVFKEFFEEMHFRKTPTGEYVEGNLGAILTQYKEDIIRYADVENVRVILQFFEDKGLLRRFEKRAIVSIAINGNYNYIVSLYDYLKDTDPARISEVLDVRSSSLWIKVDNEPIWSNTRNTTSNSNEVNEESNGRYQISNREVRRGLSSVGPSFSELEEITQLIYRKIGMFFSYEDLTDPSQQEIIKNKIVDMAFEYRITERNIKILELFGFGKDRPITRGIAIDPKLEEKMHLAIELGLLHPPMDAKSRADENDILTADAFNNPTSGSRNANETIRNYFMRYSATLHSMDIDMFILLFKYLRGHNQSDLYNKFFSDERRSVGKRSSDFLDRQELQALNNPDDMEKIKNKDFVSFYDAIDMFDFYDNAITEEEEKETYRSYFTDDVLQHPLIKQLDDTYMVKDHLSSFENTYMDVANQFVYNFDGVLISRYKVLHNASILFEQFNELTVDMLLSSIVRGSYLDDRSYKIIESACNALKNNVSQGRV